MTAQQAWWAMILIIGAIFGALYLVGNWLADVIYGGN